MQLVLPSFSQIDKTCLMMMTNNDHQDLNESRTLLNDLFLTSNLVDKELKYTMLNLQQPAHHYNDDNE